MRDELQVSIEQGECGCLEDVVCLPDANVSQSVGLAGRIPRWANQSHVVLESGDGVFTTLEGVTQASAMWSVRIYRILPGDKNIARVSIQA